jgi:nitroreductase
MNPINQGIVGQSCGVVIGRSAQRVRLVASNDRLPLVRDRGGMMSSMETWDALRARRNVRKFTPQPVAPHDLDQILEAGRRAPSAGNWQPWDFIVVTDRTQLEQLSRVWQGAGHVAGAATAIAIVAPQPEDARRANLLQYDLGQATMAIALAAADLGLGTGHAAAEDQNLARDVLGFPTDRFLAYLLSVGYPADRPLRVIERPDRRPFDDVVHRGRW